MFLRLRTYTLKNRKLFYLENNWDSDGFILFYDLTRLAFKLQPFVCVCVCSREREREESQPQQ